MNASLLLTIAFGIVISVSAWFGYVYSMTTEGFPIAGIVGAAVPPTLVIFSLVIGYVIAQGQREF